MGVALQYEIYKPQGKIINLFNNKVKNSDTPCSEYTSRGIKKASSADSVRSLDDIKNIQNFYLNNNRLRDYALFTVGICTGLRISDLCRLKVGDVLNDDSSFKEYILIREKKTGKLSSNIDDKCLITEAVQEAISKYLSNRKRFCLDEPLFYSRKAGKNNHELDTISGWRILNDAQRALDLPFHLSSHSMRKSFANIAACLGDSNNIDMTKLLSVQHMLKHSDYKTTMRYLRLTSLFTEKARNNVSDFILGKTQYNDISEALFGKSDEDSNKLDIITNLLNTLIELTEE